MEQNLNKEECLAAPLDVCAGGLRYMWSAFCAVSKLSSS
jgi:hypothetical protein